MKDKIKLETGPCAGVNIGLCLCLYRFGCIRECQIFGLVKPVEEQTFEVAYKTS